MTAYLVALLAEKDPKVLDEVITFSERADKTSGSTSDVKAGEEVPVGELMYGLMLPSGNDASVAFAEHFGERLADEKDKAAKLDAHDCVHLRDESQGGRVGHDIDALQQSEWAAERRSRDDGPRLGKLAYAAFQVPEFRKVVKTPQHGYTLDSVAGYQRNIVWRNTNQLLRTEGYDGIKTGTTNAAGNCIVSTGERDGRRIIVVVLGAPSTEGRYADSRNLYRWAWKDLLKVEGDSGENRTQRIESQLMSDLSEDSARSQPSLP